MPDPSRRSTIDAILEERLSKSVQIAHSDSVVAPLTHVQQSLWLISHLAPGEPVNNRPLWLRLRGDLDPAALDDALAAIVKRHPVLLSKFPLQDGEPVQISGHPMPNTLTRDVSDAQDPGKEARSLARSHTQRPFNLEVEVPFVPMLIKVGAGDHLLALAMHHIVFDGWSESLFVNEFIAHYDAAVAGDVADLVDLAIDYADHARWERQTTADDSFEEQIRYWTNQLADLPPDLQLPRDRAVDPEADPRAVEVHISEAVMSEIAQLANRHEATVFMVLLAALQVLVARQAGVDDVVVGVPTPGRPRSETESLIGCFINLVPIRLDLAGNPAFSELIEQTRRITLEALDNSTVPYGQLFGAVRPWSADRVPLHRVHFQMRDFHEDKKVSAHLSVDVEEPGSSTSNHLTVRALRTEAGGTITFGYDATRFHRQTIERWAGQFGRLLERIVGNPDSAILDIEFVGADERRTILEVFNPPAVPYLPPPVLAADQLRSVASRWPDLVASEDGDRHVSYAEFDRMVDAVAWSLVDRDLGAEDTVILHAERTIEAMVGVFGAMRAGVAYVPIDAELTGEWFETVVDQTKPGMVLTTGEPWIRPDGLEIAAIADLAARPVDRPFEHVPEPHDLAYLLFTSGSTGPPKGVMVEQGNVAWFLEQTADYEPLGPGDRIVLFHSLSFDAHMNSLHAALTGGATVIIRDEATVYSIPRLMAWMTENSVTHLRISAGFFHVIVEELIATGTGVPPSLRLIAFGGEQVRADIVNQWCNLTGGTVRTINSYGPTEATVWVAANDISACPDQPHEWMAIGPPRAPSRVYVVDGVGNLSPIGIFGELYIGGPLVARGYLNAPELTAERFMTDPFSDGPDPRMYRSGDVGRFLADGKLEVVGRVDRQLKIRGYRVEPAEVEAALRAVEGVDDAVVVAAESASGDLELRGFVTCSEGSLDLQSVKESLAIPKFMVPSSLAQVAEIPMTISGKVDKNRLLQTVVEPTVPAPNPHSQSDTIERIWCDVLGLTTVDPADDFFALGGHSLLAIKVISRIKAQLDLNVELTQLFEHPTFGAFSAMVNGVSSRLDRPEPTIQPAPDDLDTLLTSLEEMTDEEAEEMLKRLEAGDV